MFWSRFLSRPSSKKVRRFRSPVRPVLEALEDRLTPANVLWNLNADGAFNSADAVPGGVIADAFYAKGQHEPQALLDTIAELIRTSAARSVQRDAESAPVWIPRNGTDSKGIPYVVLTCTECLRSFPLSVPQESTHSSEIQEMPCLFCLSLVRYIIDFSNSVASPSRERKSPIFDERLRNAASKVG